jgi:hypothetical protein
MMKAKTVYRQSKVKNDIKILIEKELPRIKSKVDEPSLNKYLDPLSEELGQKCYQKNMRFSWLKLPYGGRLHPLEVERYYEPLKLCIDIRHGEKEIPYTDEKEKMCRENGHRYFYLRTGEDVKKMLTVLGGH